MKKLLFILLLLPIFAIGQTFDHTAEFKDSLLLGRDNPNFVIEYLGSEREWEYVTFHEFSTDSINWHKIQTPSDIWVRFSNDNQQTWVTLPIKYVLEVTGNETAFDGWDKNESDDFSGDYNDLINPPDLNIYLTEENDPIFSAWDKDYNDLINTPTIPSGNQIIDWTLPNQGAIDPTNYIDNNTQLSDGEIGEFGYIKTYVEIDPIFTAHTSYNINDGLGLLRNDGLGNWSYDNSSYLTSYTETDPIFSAWDKDYSDLINTPTIPSQYWYQSGNNLLPLFSESIKIVGSQPSIELIDSDQPNLYGMYFNVNNDELHFTSYTNGAVNYQRPFDILRDGIKPYKIEDSNGSFGTVGQILTSAGSSNGITWESPSFGDMYKSTYDPANIDEQLVGLTASQSLTNKIINGVTLDNTGSASLFLNQQGNYVSTTVDLSNYVDKTSDEYISGLKKFNESVEIRSGNYILLNSGGYVKFISRSSAPTGQTSSMGDLWMNSSDNKLYFTNNGTTYDLTSSGSGGGDMYKSTYDPAAINEQLVGLTATQSLTNKSVNGVTLQSGGSGSLFLTQAGTYASATGSGTDLSFSGATSLITLNSSSGNDVQFEPGTGISFSGSTSGRLVITATSGGGEMVYPSAGIPVSTGSSWGTSITNSSGNWNDAYNNKIVSAAVTGTTTKTITLNQQDGGTVTASWTDIQGEAGGGLTSVGISMPTGFSVPNSPLTTDGTLNVSFASGYSLPTTLSQTNWNYAYNNSITGFNKTTAPTYITVYANQHDGGSTSFTLDDATTSSAGLMNSTDKEKINDLGSISTKGFWTGTQAAYEAINPANGGAGYDNNTIYFIED